MNEFSPKLFELFQKNQFSECKKIANEFLEKNTPIILDTYKIIGKIAFAENRLEQAFDYWEKALHLDDKDKELLVLLAEKKYLPKCTEDRSFAEKAALLCQKALDMDSNYNSALQLRNKIPQNLPGIFFNTLPKSGSIFLLRNIMNGFAVPRKRISQGLFPNDVLEPSLVQELMRGNAVDHQHIPPTERNLYTLAKFGIKKFIVHVRDPRQAFLSFIHHFDAYGELILDSIDFMLNDDTYFSLNFEQKISWGLNNLYPLMVNWISQWISVEKSNKYGIAIKFTEFLDMKNDPDKFFADFLQFYALSKNWFAPITKMSEKDDNWHFRKGLADEWRSSFTKKQIEIANDMLPEHMMNKFGWQY